MPTLKIKPPQKYPGSYHDAVAAGLGERILTSGSKPHCLLVAKKFRCFLKSLKEYPQHPLQNVLVLCDVGTRTRQQPSGGWGLWVIVNRKINWKAAIQ